MDQRPYSLADFKPTCWWQATSPDSSFTQRTTCSLLTETGRITLTAGKLLHTVDGKREEQILDGDQAVLDAYRTHFGVPLTVRTDEHRTARDVATWLRQCEHTEARDWIHPVTHARTLVLSGSPPRSGPAPPRNRHLLQGPPPYANFRRPGG